MKQATTYIVLLLLVAYTFVKGVIPAWNQLNSDFPNYYLSAKIVMEGKDINRLYDDQWFNERLQFTGLAEGGKFSPFPPATALVMLPLAFMPPLTAKRVWTVCNVFFLLFSIYLLQKVTGWNWAVCALLVLITGQGLINNFRFGQLYLFVFCMIVFSHFLITKERSNIAGIILGIVAVVKYFPVVFIAGYGLTGNRQLVAYAISTMLALVIVQIEVFRLDIFTYYLSQVLIPHLQGNLSMQSPYAIAFQSWESLLRTIFVPDLNDNPYPPINWPGGKWLVQGLIYTLIITTTIYLLWQARSLQKPLKQWIYLSLPALAALVLSPASATYHYLLLIFPFTLVLLILKEYYASLWVIGWFIFLYMGINWAHFTYMQRIIEPKGWGILLFYPRLWLILLLYLSYAWIVYQNLVKK